MLLDENEGRRNSDLKLVQLCALWLLEKLLSLGSWADGCECRWCSRCSGLNLDGMVTGILVMALAAAAESGLTTGSAITDGCISDAAAAYPLCFCVGHERSTMLFDQIRSEGGETILSTDHAIYKQDTNSDMKGQSVPFLYSNMTTSPGRQRGDLTSQQAALCVHANGTTQSGSATNNNEQ